MELREAQHQCTDLDLRFRQTTTSDGRYCGPTDKAGRAWVQRYQDSWDSAQDIFGQARNADGNLSRMQKQELRVAIHKMEDAMEAIETQRPGGSAAFINPNLDAEDGGGGSQFENFSDYLAAVLVASHPHTKTVDDRLQIGAAPTTYGSEGVGEDGGYLVPPGWANEIFQHTIENDSLLDFTRRTPVRSNAMTFPVSEATPWGTAGVQCYWEGEAGQITQSKPAFEGRELRLRKLTALVGVTEELLEDAPALAAWLPRELGVAARWKVNDAIVNGSGSGVPQGFINSGAIVEQAKETAQTADTIVAENITKMYARCSNPSAAVWIINPDAFNQLPLMTIGDQPVWLTVSDGLRSSPGGQLLGRPVILSESCQTVGDAGDIYFADLSSYAIIMKAGGPRIATSMHLWFDYNMTAFRLTFRIDGQSLIRAAMTPPNSSVTRSPYVRLAARA